MRKIKLGIRTIFAMRSILVHMEDFLDSLFHTSCKAFTSIRFCAFRIAERGFNGIGVRTTLFAAPKK